VKLGVNFFGGAANAKNADEMLAGLQNRRESEDRSVLKSVVHQADFVGRLIGLNPATGGTMPVNADGSAKSQVSEWANIFSGEYTAHNCYGTAPAGCSAYWAVKPVPIAPNGVPRTPSQIELPAPDAGGRP
jgi:filamentous hemagglutinin